MDSGQHAGERRPGIIRRFVNLVVCIAIVLAAAWGIRSFVIEPFEVPSASMETTIMTGDRLFAEKVSYHFSEPKAGDIVVFSDPQVPSRVLVKRIIATEGDHIRILADGGVEVNGARLQEEYVHDRTDGLVDMTVPRGTVFVMGDNRGESFDSRNMGAIPCEDLKGKVFFRLFPLGRIR